MTKTTEIGKSMPLLFSWALVDQPCLSQGKYACLSSTWVITTLWLWVTLIKINFFFNSLSVTAELIGPNHESGAFIYGFMSLVEKVTNGILIIGVQSLAASKSGREDTFYTQVLFYVCGGACLVGASAMLSLAPVEIGRRYWKPKAMTMSDRAEKVEIPAIHINSQNVTEDF